MTELLEELRPKAFAIAYRMLGSVGEAEDIVQEALLRLHTVMAAGERIESPQAYLATVVTRLGIDELRSARARRETYVGEWLPEPLVTGDEDDPAVLAETADSLSLALLVVLESLSPEQRAVFLLRDVFDYPYSEIARIVGKTEAAARQLAARARQHVQERRPRFDPRREQRQALADRFLAAIRDGDLAALTALLAHDVSLHGDGGGKAPALARALHGRDRVARALLGWARAGSRAGGFTARRLAVNRQPGLLILDSQDKLVGVMALDIAHGQIWAIRSVLNPDKLRHLGPTANPATPPPAPAPPSPTPPAGVLLPAKE